MRTKRINTELYDTITVTDKSGNAIDFSTAYDIYLYLQKQGSSSLLKQDFALNGDTLSYQFNSDENNRGLGTYDLHLEWKKKDANSELTYDQYHFDYLGCFKIVRFSDEENWSEGVSGTVLQFGADGLSAYELAVKNGYVGMEQEWLAYLRKPAVDAAASLSVLESSVSSNETTRNSNETIRIDNENERVVAENERVVAETARESNSATAVTNANNAASNANNAASNANNAASNANNAASNANTAASNFANAVVQEEGTNTDKVISQKVVTDELANKVDKIAGMGLSTNDYTNTDKSQVAQNKDTNSVQDTVVAEALAKLNQEFEAFKKMLQSGNIGDIHVTSVNTDSVPMYCGQQMIIKGSGSPVTNSIIPDFEGQIYIDTTNRNAYMCCDSASTTYWKQLN